MSPAKKKAADLPHLVAVAEGRVLYQGAISHGAGKLLTLDRDEALQLLEDGTVRLLNADEIAHWKEHGQ